MPSMTSAPGKTPTARPFPIGRFDLAAEIDQMRNSPRSAGHVGKTLLHDKDVRIVLMLLDRGAQIPTHRAKGALTFQGLEGRMIITLLGTSFDLAPGQLLAIERNVAHALVAVEDSALLLTIAPRTLTASTRDRGRSGDR